jgi:hypothetical protein
MNWPALLTFLAELTAWIAILFGGAIVFMTVWAAAGIGSNRLREAADRTKQASCEIGGVVGVRTHVGTEL